MREPELPQLQAVLKELAEYADFGRRWDGYSAEEFDSQLLENVMSFATRVFHELSIREITPTQFSPGPASDGSVDLEVATGNRRVCFTFYPREPIRVSLEENGKAVVSRVKSEEFEGIGAVPIREISLDEELAWLQG